LKPTAGNDVIILELVSDTKQQITARHLIMLYYQSSPMSTDVQEFPYEKIKTGQIIGKGAYGVVQLVNLDEGEHKQVAVKELVNLHSLPEDEEQGVLAGFGKDSIGDLFYLRTFVVHNHSILYTYYFRI
jgi:hypothetical protein